VVITLVLSILLAYCLDPLVEFLERWHIPTHYRLHGHGASAVCGDWRWWAMGLWSRASDFAEKLAEIQRRCCVRAANSVEAKIQRHRAWRRRNIAATKQSNQASIRAARGDTGIVRNLIIRSIGIAVRAVSGSDIRFPFLVFFMFGWKNAKPGTARCQLFPASRRNASERDGWRICAVVLRDYVLWMSVVNLDGDHIQQPVFLGGWASIIRSCLELSPAS